MEVIMITKKINKIKKVSYFCLTLFSTALPSTTEAMDSFFREDVGRSTARRNVIVPQQNESLLDKFMLLFQSDDANEDESQVDDHSQRYSDLKNKIIDKYEKDRPELSRFRKPIKQKEKSSNLVSTSKDFRDVTGRLGKTIKQENEDLKTLEETIIKAAGYVGKEILDDKIKDPESKSFFLELLDKGQEQVLNFINQ